MFEDNYKKLIIRFSKPVTGKPYPGVYVIEECAELIQAIIHAERGRADANPVKEMAHVITMIDALLLYWDIDRSEIKAYQQDLIDRYLNVPNDGRHVPEIGLVNQTKEG